MKIKFSIKIIPVYFVALALAVCAGAILYMTYSACASLVAGQNFSPFSSTLFLRGLYSVFPAAFSLVPVFVVFYVIRRTEVAGLSVPVFMVLHLCLWLFFVPFVKNTYENARLKQRSTPQTFSPLSSGYFRSSESDKYIFYYTRINSENIASGVCIDRTKPEDNVYTFSDIKLSSIQEGFTDTLIRDTVEMPVTLRVCLSYLQAFTSAAYEMCSSGIVRWLLFSSVTVAILSVFFLYDFSSWRLVNVLVIFVVYVFIFLGNYFISNAPDTILKSVPLISAASAPQEIICCAFNVLVFIANFGRFFVAALYKKDAVDLDGDIV